MDFLENDPYVKQANFAIAVPYPGTEVDKDIKASIDILNWEDVIFSKEETKLKYVL